MDGGKNNQAPAPEAKGANQAQPNAANGGEKERQISDILKRRMGELAVKTAEMDGGLDGKNGEEGYEESNDVNIVITEKDRTDTSNVINEAVNQKISEGISGRPLLSLLQKTILKPILTAGYRVEAANAVRKAGGNADEAFRVLGVKDAGRMNKNSHEYAEMKARLALNETGFKEDIISADNSLVLNEGEKIERIKDERQEIVTKALKKLFSDLEEASNHKDPELLAEAKEKYQNEVDRWQEQGLFGEKQSNVGTKILESWLATFLIGDHSRKSLTELDSLRKMGDGVEDLVNEKIHQTDFDNYLENHLSLFSANMKEGIYTKQVVDNVTAAVAAGGLAGAVAYSLMGRARYGAKQAVGTEIAKESAKAVSNAAMGAALGGAFGAAAGFTRGFNKARVKLSQAETEQALSGEAIVTPEEKVVRKIEVTEPSEAAGKQSSEEIAAEEASNQNEAERSEEGVEEHEIKFPSLSHKQKIAAVMNSVNKLKRKITGEDVNKAKVEERLKRKSAKEFYDELNDKLMIIELIDTKGKDRNRKISELREKDADAFEQMMRRVVKVREGESEGKITERFQKFLAEKGSREKMIEKITETVADIRARNKVSAEKKIDLIKYSKGNVSRERMLLAEKMMQAQKIVNREQLNESTEIRAETYLKSNKEANKARANFIARQAIVDMVIGGLTGSAIGAITGHFKDVKEAREAAVAGISGSSAGNTANVDNEVTVNADEDLDNNISIEDRDGDGTFAVYDNEGNPIISEEQGLHIENGKISEGDLALLREKGVDVQELEPRVEMVEGYHTQSVETYFSKSDENYVGNLDAGGEVNRANTVVDIERASYVVSGNGNRAADIIVDSTPINDGDIVLQVVSKDSGINVDDLQVALTPSREIGDMGIILDVAEDGTVTIPAGSVAASMFADGGGGFTGGTMEVIRDAASGNGYDVLATSFGSNSLAEIGFSETVEKANYAYVINGVEWSAPNEAMVEERLGLVGVESLRDSGPVEYAPGETKITINGLGSGDATETITVPHRTGNYSEINDPFFSEYKESPALNSYNMVQRLVDPDMEMTSEEANNALIEAVNNGEISTERVVNVYLEQMGNSPEQIVEMRAMLGDFQFDIDGDGAMELIDTDWEVNVVADILKNSADGDGYSAFINDTYTLLFDKLSGGEIRLVNYAEESYDYTTLGYLDKLNNVIHQFARKKSACSGIGLEFLDKDGKSIYNLDIARRIWRMPTSARLEHVTERLNCGQKTADVSWVKKVQRVVEQSGEINNQVNPTAPPTSSSTPTSTPTDTPTPPTPPTPPGPGPKLTPKTDTNPWADRNSQQMSVDAGFENEPAANNGAPIVQFDQEQIPVVDNSGVNVNPEGMIDGASQPTIPEQNIGINPSDVSPSSDQGAAAELAEAEAALKATIGGGS